jgi:hypothetical protein
MIRPTKATADGRAYLELQNLARKERKVTGELLTMYVVERWLARLAISAYRDDFVLKGGMLLASFGARRPTADADVLARNMAADEQTVVQRVVDIALIAMPEDGVRFDADSVRAQQIREEAVYAGTRVRMDAHLATADVRLSLDINFGDPVTPGPQPIQLPPLRPGMEPISILGYPVETVIAEKLMTAVALGATNTRVRELRRHLDAHQQPPTGPGHDVAGTARHIDLPRHTDRTVIGRRRIHRCGPQHHLHRLPPAARSRR